MTTDHPPHDLRETPPTSPTLIVDISVSAGAQKKVEHVVSILKSPLMLTSTRSSRRVWWSNVVHERLLPPTTTDTQASSPPVTHVDSSGFAPPPQAKASQQQSQKTTTNFAQFYGNVNTSPAQSPASHIAPQTSPISPMTPQHASPMARYHHFTNAPPQGQNATPQQPMWASQQASRTPPAPRAPRPVNRLLFSNQPPPHAGLPAAHHAPSHAPPSARHLAVRGRAMHEGGTTFHRAGASGGLHIAAAHTNQAMWLGVQC
mmetsp:Transcript_33590/g.65549  ORF Transcript_33590/g.65549 Transcript_33590/m.65549 type:complete len:260 (+) Transcript_33590:202-981(+)|eukprot:CAMPEP_0173393360 /NCGR_PEP_ID=MMETSP1356-20130122/22064_1 /TAXON_ID=77927 ORGANISM="Hemiselmis virescens, Strain PCC157" /NCGR_SAMPLE_ID=MMETSP1356 /ASSEMBLY_ACC=CAM_ASM_000847 /LENGTH=259 /DNA_ID=CAMNT_0014351369 /DNA_START=265 /DNA_END=1044 /DNA_ORIENTATION=+